MSTSCGTRRPISTPMNPPYAKFQTNIMYNILETANGRSTCYTLYMLIFDVPVAIFGCGCHLLSKRRTNIYSHGGHGYVNINIRPAISLYSLTIG